MSIPSAPSISSIVTEALKRAGRTSPTATQISDATTHQFREVKADIMLVAPTHPYLETNATAYTVKGQQRYALPSDCNVPVSLALLMGPSDWTGTAQSGASSSITLANSLSVDAENLIGKFILLTGGTGAGQYRQCLAWNNTTKVWTTEIAWGTTPDSTTTYQIINETRNLWQSHDIKELDQNTSPFALGTPRTSFYHGDEFYLYPTPNLSTYGLLYRYYVDLDQLDDAGTVFLNLLREWRSLWIQGVAVKCMQRYDEDRYQSELMVYKAMLDMLTNQCSRVVTGAFYDV